MAFPDNFPAPFPAAAEAAIEVEATLALGRLDGALGACRPATLRLFATRLLRHILIAALRQEGHAFTDQRFHAWFAGLATLSDQPPRLARPPRVLCEAILIELAHSSWEPLASLAPRFESALLAPRDYIGNDRAAETAHEEARTLVTAARDLIAQLEPCPLPLPALARLHRAVGEDILFAPTERAPEPITMGPMRLTVERAALPSPRWAIEMLWGEHWRAAGLMRCALPFPGLIRLDALRGDTDPADARTILATALRDVAQGLCDSLAEANRFARRIADLPPGRRSTSRAPALFELLAGFGALRSTQIETLLGATRLGVRSMLAALGDIGVLERTTLSGVRLYTVTDRSPAAPEVLEAADGFVFSHAALDEFNASMAHLDELLARGGAGSDDAEDQD